MMHSEYKWLDRIDSPDDLKKLSGSDLRQYCDELRQYIIEQCSSNPGHLASSLGAVELAVALHYVFNTPDDKIVWDVGHQTYAHKIITGRREAFRTNRKLGNGGEIARDLRSIKAQLYGAMGIAGPKGFESRFFAGLLSHAVFQGCGAAVEHLYAGHSLQSKEQIPQTAAVGPIGVSRNAHAPTLRHIVQKLLRHQVGSRKLIDAESYDIPLAGQIFHPHKDGEVLLLCDFGGILSQADLIVIRNADPVQTLALGFRHHIQQIHLAVAGKGAFMEMCIYDQCSVPHFCILCLLSKHNI